MRAYPRELPRPATGLLLIGCAGALLSIGAILAGNSPSAAQPPALTVGAMTLVDEAGTVRAELRMVGDEVALFMSDAVGVRRLSLRVGEQPVVRMMDSEGNTRLMATVLDDAGAGFMVLSPAGRVQAELRADGTTAVLGVGGDLKSTRFLAVVKEDRASIELRNKDGQVEWRQELSNEP